MKFKIIKEDNGHRYYYVDNGKLAIIMNRYSYHEDNDPENKYLKKRFIFYVYDKKDQNPEDYIYDCDYKRYEMYPTIKECKSFIEYDFIEK